MGSTYRPPGKNQELSPFDTTSKEFDEGEENTHVQYRRLGKSGLQVSVPIFGAMSLGSSKYMDWITDEEEVCPIVPNLNFPHYIWDMWAMGQLLTQS
jgi:hypothetical protein